MSKIFSKVILLSIVVYTCISCRSLVPVQLQYAQESVNASANLDSHLIALYMPYKVKLDSAMHIVLVESSVEMNKQQPECALGNMLTDIMYSFAQQTGISPDLAISNYGGIRVGSLPAGVLTVEDAYKLMPFDNTLVVLPIKGDVLRQLIDHAAESGGWPISHASYHIFDGKAENILINGVPLSDEKTYKLVTNDYIAGGGDYCDMLKGITPFTSEILIRDMIISNWQKVSAEGKKLNYTIEGRVSYVQ